MPGPDAENNHSGKFQPPRIRRTRHATQNSNDSNPGERAPHILGQQARAQEIDEFSFAPRAKVRDGQIVLWHWFEDSFALS